MYRAYRPWFVNAGMSPNSCSSAVDIFALLCKHDQVVLGKCGRLQCCICCCRSCRCPTTDPTREIAVAYGMIDPELKDADGLPLTCRSVFIVGPDKKLKLSLKYVEAPQSICRLL